MTPTVSVLVPARNEAANIAACVRSILAQRLDGELEVIVVDDGSSDDTGRIAREAGATVITGPHRGISAALNRGLADAQAGVLLRFDAHAEMPPGYVAACLRALTEEPNAANVGGWREVRGTGPWGRAIGAALASPFGVGNPVIWRPPRNGDFRRRDVDHVPLGCFPTLRLREIGGWPEELLTNEDYDLSYRLRSAGGRVLFDPAIWSIYRPRESLAAIAAQYWRYGTWKAAMLWSSPRSVRPRQLAPPLLVAVALGATLPSPARRAARVALAGYAGCLVVVSGGLRTGWRTAPVLAAMHGAWGAGLLVGLARAWRRHSR